MYTDVPMFFTMKDLIISIFLLLVSARDNKAFNCNFPAESYKVSKIVLEVYCLNVFYQGTISKQPRTIRSKPSSCQCSYFHGFIGGPQ